MQHSPFHRMLVGGLVARLLLLLYGLWQDATLRVPFTDIDYHVFTDASRAVVGPAVAADAPAAMTSWTGWPGYLTSRGLAGTPYARATYRYTPLLAWLLVPNLGRVSGWPLGMVWGKLCFILMDMVAAWALHRLCAPLRQTGNKRSRGGLDPDFDPAVNVANKQAHGVGVDKMDVVRRRLRSDTRRARAQGLSTSPSPNSIHRGKQSPGKRTSPWSFIPLWQHLTTHEKWIAVLWLFNPMVMTLSARGNADTLIVVLVLTALAALQKGHRTLGAMLYGLSVHVKIYPIVYALPIWLWLKEETPVGTTRRHRKGRDDAVLAGVKGFFAPCRIRFGLVSGGVFLLLFAIMYALYGDIFMYETYLYHLIRKDHRHNFSVYFYHMYLTFQDQITIASADGTAVASEGTLVGLLAFLPQVVLLALVGVLYHDDLVFACFMQTFYFVMFNKVCTSQYFLWYICFLPLVLPKCRGLTLTRGLTMLLAWFGAQGLWLYYAYRLEFLGENTFFEIWCAGLFFFLVNIWVGSTIVHLRSA